MYIALGKTASTLPQRKIRDAPMCHFVVNSEV